MNNVIEESIKLISGLLFLSYNFARHTRIIHTCYIYPYSSDNHLIETTSINKYI